MKHKAIISRLFYDCISILPLERQAIMYNAIIEYELNEKEPNFEGEDAAIFKLLLLYLTKKLADPYIGRSRVNQETIDRNCRQMRLWRESVLKRDNYICQKCGLTSNLEAHHIKEFARYPDLRFDINNGLTVCKPCHKEIHKRKKK